MTVEALLSPSGSELAQPDPALYELVAGHLAKIIQRSDEMLLWRFGSLRLPDGSMDPQLGIKAFCPNTSDAITRAAQELGLPAAKEVLEVPEGSHSITYFGPPGEPAGDADLILCRTWGQFNEALYNNKDGNRSPYVGRPFLGSRAQLRGLLDMSITADYVFSAQAVGLRQTIHRERAAGYGLSGPDASHEWLNTTPADHAKNLFTTDDAMAGHYDHLGWS